MSKFATVEEYARHVHSETFLLIGDLCSRLGPGHPTTVALANLVTEAATIANQGEMVRESAGDFDLGELSRLVDVSRPTDSECPFRDE